MKTGQIALQIWTLRDVMEKDFEQAFEEAARIGYAGVEIGDTPDMNVADFKQMLEDLELKCVGCHVPIGTLESDLDRVVKQHLALGTEYIVVPWLDEAYRADYRKTGQRMLAIADKLKQRGLNLCYHNHAFEFEKQAGVYGYDLIAESFAPNRLGAELDVYWVTYGNEDPIDYINKLSGRLPLLHMKDMESSPDRAFCEVGHGTIDMQAIVSAGDAAGVQWYIVEQDVCKRDPVESVEMSYDALAAIAEDY